MKRYGWLVVALLALPLTALALPRAGRSNPEVERPAVPSTIRLDEARSRDQRLSEAAWRWRNCQPHHWRDCLLQR